jgi:hypothetical protein
MEIKEVIIYGALIVSIVGVIGIMLNRLYLNKGMGLRTVQLLAIIVLFPFLLILSLIEILPVSVIAVVAGSIIGYSFAQKKD